MQLFSLRNGRQLQSSKEVIMKLEELVKSVVKKAPEMDIRSWLDRQAEEQKRIPPYDYYDEIDMEVAKDVIRKILYLKYKQKKGRDTTKTFRELSLEADKKNRIAIAFFMALSEMDSMTQEKGIEDALTVIEHIAQSNVLPDDEKLWAEKNGEAVNIYAENGEAITVNGDEQHD